MSNDATTALIAAAGVIVSAAIAFVSSRENAKSIGRNAQEIEKLKIVAQERRDTSRFVEPLMRSAYDLQSRIYNSLRGDLFATFYVNGDDRERNYTLNYTLYLIAQYFCWSEIVRRSVQLTNLVEDEHARDLLRIQEEINSLWSTDYMPRVLRIFAGEQRAIGEALIEVDPQGADCMGYLEFLEKIEMGEHPLIDAVKADILAFAENPGSAAPRLQSIQHSLIDLLRLLDPNDVRFPVERRRKV